MDAFIWPVRAYYEDTDSGGLVYHANYLKFMERARTEWLRGMGFEQLSLQRELGTIFTVRSLEIDFLKPARLDDALQVVTHLQALRGASMVFEQSVTRDQIETELLCRARVKIACCDARTLRPRAIPERIKAELEHVG